jgi:hypothetical protein
MTSASLSLLRIVSLQLLHRVNNLHHTCSLQHLCLTKQQQPSVQRLAKAASIWRWKALYSSTCWPIAAPGSVCTPCELKLKSHAFAPHKGAG